LGFSDFVKAILTGFMTQLSVVTYMIKVLNFVGI